MRIAVMSRKRSLYSTKRLLEEIKSAGHEAVMMNPLRCDIIVGRQDSHIYYNQKRVKGIGVVIPRIGSAVTRYGLNVLRQFREMGVVSLNDPESIAIARDKFHALQYLTRNDIPVPKTIMVRNPRNLLKAINLVGGVPVIMKQIKGTHGVGMILVESSTAAASTFDTLLSLGHNIFIQEFILESRGTDLRCIVVDGEIVAACQRFAPIGEFRANFHKGGLIEKVELSQEEKETAISAAKSLGLGVAGIDLLRSARGPLVLEANASPGLEGIEKATGINVAKSIVEYASKFNGS